MRKSNVSLRCFFISDAITQPTKKCGQIFNIFDRTFYSYQDLGVMQSPHLQ